MFGAIVVAAACASQAKNSGYDPTAGAQDAGADVDLDAPSPDLVVEAGEGGAVGHLKGKVYAPEGTIPVPNALVYLTDRAPDPIPDGVYCDKCVELSSTMPFAYTNADGTFDLPVTTQGSYDFVVQKGAFRRVRPIDVGPGVANVPDVFTTLPSKTDKAKGDDVPKMAVVLGYFDHIELSLAELGLGTVGADGGIAEGSFDMYSPGGTLDAHTLLTDPATISKYHVVFIPCSGDGSTHCSDTLPGDPRVQKTLSDFVAAGGKLYVTDYSYEYVRQPFPGRIQWEGETPDLGSACQSTSYDAPALVQDKGLGDWLTAVGDSNVTLERNWTTIASVAPIDDIDVDGGPVKVTPKVWVSAAKQGGTRPATVSFGHACGRVLFSTYHTEVAGTKLLPQEKALLYVLLEVIGVCVTSPTIN